MQPSIRLSLALAGSSALTLASNSFLISPAGAEDLKVTQGAAKDLGVMEVNLKDAVKLNYGFQGALQGAGTPNQAGLGAFIPLKVTKNGPDGKALYRLADPRCEAWNKVVVMTLIPWSPCPSSQSFSLMVPASPSSRFATTC